MSNTTFSFAKSAGNTYYFKTFVSESQSSTLPWQKFFTTRSSKRKTEQAYSYAGLPLPQATKELVAGYVADMSELAATTITNTMYTLNSRFSWEALNLTGHNLPDIMGKAGKRAGKAHSQLRDSVVSLNLFDRAFATTTTYDGSYLCDSHTTNAGDTIDNDGGPSSLDFDSYWDAVDYFHGSIYDEAGLRIMAEPKWLVVPTALEREGKKILESKLEPDTADNNANTAPKVELIVNPFQSSTSAWFLIAKEFKDDAVFLNVLAPQYTQEDDKDVRGTTMYSQQMFGLGFLDYRFIYGNPGS